MSKTSDRMRSKTQPMGAPRPRLDAECGCVWRAPELELFEEGGGDA